MKKTQHDLLEKKKLHSFASDKKTKSISMNETLKKILMGLLVAFVILLTLKYVKMLPAIMKVLALAGNVITIYWAYTVFKNKSKKDKKDEQAN